MVDSCQIAMRRKLMQWMNNGNSSTKEKLAALKLIIESNEARFKLLSEGPSVLAIKSLEERLNKIESVEARQQVN